EGKEFLQQFPDCPPEIANCRKRIEIFFPDKSADMEHFNNYLFMCHAAEFRGVILVDLASGKVMSQRDGQ
ncbi:MAG: hypothetical protein IT324_16515, partial [Anaerolineae bacterium]|nr:hypothetical protein [Anaerolineae bacterium]